MTAILRQFHIAWLMLSHRPARFLFSLLGIAFSVMIMSMQVGFFYGLNDAQANLVPKLECDLAISTPKKKHLRNFKKTFRHYAHQVRNLPEVESITDIYMRPNLFVNPQDGTISRAVYIGVDLDNPMMDSSAVAAHRNALRKPNTILFDDLSRSNLGDIEPGMTVKGAKGAQMEVVGLFELGANFSYEGNLLMSAENFITLNGAPIYGQDIDWVDMVLVKLRPGTDLDTAQKKIQTMLGDYCRVHSLQQLRKREFIVTTKQTPSGFILGIGLIIGVVIGIVFCYQVLFNEISDNITQFATVKAIGHQVSYLAGIVLSCALIVATGGFAIGLIGNVGIYELLEQLTEIQFHLTTERMSSIFLLSITMCVSSGMLALRKVLKADPAELF